MAEQEEPAVQAASLQQQLQDEGLSTPAALALLREFPVDELASKMSLILSRIEQLRQVVGMDTINTLIRAQPRMVRRLPVSLADNLQSIGRLLGLNRTQLERLVGRCTWLVNSPLSSMESRLALLTELLGDRAAAVKCVNSCPSLLVTDSSKLHSSLQQLQQVFGLPSALLGELVVRHPQLLIMDSHSNLEKHLELLQQELALSRPAAVALLLKVPGLLMMPAVRLQQRLSGLCALLHCAPSQLATFLTAYPAAISRDTDTLARTLAGHAKVLQLDESAMLEVVWVMPGFLGRSPQSLQAQLEGLSELLSLSKDGARELLVKHKGLLSLSRQRMEQRWFRVKALAQQYDPWERELAGMTPTGMGWCLTVTDRTLSQLEQMLSSGSTPIITLAQAVRPGPRGVQYTLGRLQRAEAITKLLQLPRSFQEAIASSGGTKKLLAAKDEDVLNRWQRLAAVREACPHWAPYLNTAEGTARLIVGSVVPLDRLEFLASHSPSIDSQELHSIITAGAVQFRRKYPTYYTEWKVAKMREQAATDPRTQSDLPLPRGQAAHVTGQQSIDALSAFCQQQQQYSSTEAPADLGLDRPVKLVSVQPAVQISVRPVSCTNHQGGEQRELGPVDEAPGYSPEIEATGLLTGRATEHENIRLGSVPESGPASSAVSELHHTNDAASAAGSTTANGSSVLRHSIKTVPAPEGVQNGQSLSSSSSTAGGSFTTHIPVGADKGRTVGNAINEDCATMKSSSSASERSGSVFGSPASSTGVSSQLVPQVTAAAAGQQAAAPWYYTLSPQLLSHWESITAVARHRPAWQQSLSSPQNVAQYLTFPPEAITTLQQLLECRQLVQPRSLFVALSRAQWLVDTQAAVKAGLKEMRERGPGAQAAKPPCGGEFVMHSVLEGGVKETVLNVDSVQQTGNSEGVRGHGHGKESESEVQDWSRQRGESIVRRDGLPGESEQGMLDLRNQVPGRNGVLGESEQGLPKVEKHEPGRDNAGEATNQQHAATSDLIHFKAPRRACGGGEAIPQHIAMSAATCVGAIGAEHATDSMVQLVETRSVRARIPPGTSVDSSHSTVFEDTGGNGAQHPGNTTFLGESMMQQGTIPVSSAVSRPGDTQSVGERVVHGGTCQVSSAISKRETDVTISDPGVTQMVRGSVLQGDGGEMKGEASSLVDDCVQVESTLSAEARCTTSSPAPSSFQSATDTVGMDPVPPADVLPAGVLPADVPPGAAPPATARSAVVPPATARPAVVPPAAAQSAAVLPGVAPLQAETECDTQPQSPPSLSTPQSGSVTSTTHPTEPTTHQTRLYAQLASLPPDDVNKELKMLLSFIMQSNRRQLPSLQQAYETLSQLQAGEVPGYQEWRELWVRLGKAAELAPALGVNPTVIGQVLERVPWVGQEPVENLSQHLQRLRSLIAPLPHLSCQLSAESSCSLTLAKSLMASSACLDELEWALAHGWQLSPSLRVALRHGNWVASMLPVLQEATGQLPGEIRSICWRKPQMMERKLETSIEIVRRLRLAGETCEAWGQQVRRLSTLGYILYVGRSLTYFDRIQYLQAHHPPNKPLPTIVHIVTRSSESWNRQHPGYEEWLESQHAARGAQHALINTSSEAASEMTVEDGGNKRRKRKLAIPADITGRRKSSASRPAGQDVVEALKGAAKETGQQLMPYVPTLEPAAAASTIGLAVVGDGGLSSRHESLQRRRWSAIRSFCTMPLAAGLMACGTSSHHVAQTPRLQLGWHHTTPLRWMTFPVGWDHGSKFCENKLRSGGKDGVRSAVGCYVSGMTAMYVCSQWKCNVGCCVVGNSTCWETRRCQVWGSSGNGRGMFTAPAPSCYYNVVQMLKARASVGLVCLHASVRMVWAGCKLL